MFQPAKAHKPALLLSNAVCLFSPGRNVVFFLFSTILLAAALRPVGSLAQTQASDGEVVRVTTDLLLFPVRIRDKQGRAVTGLTLSDLSLKDEDHATSAIHFSAGAERVSLVFALDQSGSLHELISQQREAALALFRRFSDRSRIAVLRFAETPFLIAPFGRDIDAVGAAFDFSARANQHTAIFDGAAAAIMAFDELVPDRADRHIVVLISDGLDNASKLKANKVIDAALDKRVSFYVIHLPLFEPRDGRLAVRQPAKGFRDLAEKTGGKYFLAGDSNSALTPSGKNKSDLTPVFQAIEEDLKSQYLLGFYIDESARDGRSHRFSVSLVPRAVEYAVGRLGYSRTHHFFVNMRPGETKIPK